MYQGLWQREHLALTMAGCLGLGGRRGYLVFLPPLFRQLIALPDPIKIALSVMLIAPLAFAMGMPFPLLLYGAAALVFRSPLCERESSGAGGYSQR